MSFVVTVCSVVTEMTERTVMTDALIALQRPFRPRADAAARFARAPQSYRRCAHYNLSLYRAQRL